jgi:hypothetical protein
VLQLTPSLRLPLPLLTTAAQVAGTFYFTLLSMFTKTGGGKPHMMTLNDVMKYNASHVVNHLTFGKPFPGQKTPLDSNSAVIPEGACVLCPLCGVVPPPSASHPRCSHPFSLPSISWCTVPVPCEGCTHHLGTPGGWEWDHRERAVLCNAVHAEDGLFVGIHAAARCFLQV